MHTAPAIHVHMLPSLIAPGALHGGVAVVIDVLRATTAMVHALAAGCEAVVPCAEIDEAKAAAAALGRGKAILGGERGGLPIEGFDLGNSPREYTRDVCRGKTLVMTTTNGTRAILASLDAERVLVAAFVNFRATADELSLEFLKAHGRSVHLICAGTEGHISLEDTLLAGALASELAGRQTNAKPGNDSTAIAERLWLKAVQDFDWAQGISRRGIPTTHGLQRLVDFLKLGRGSQNVLRIGLGPDIDDAARVDRFRLVAHLQRDPLRIVAAET